MLGRPALLLVGGAFDESAVNLVHAVLLFFSIRLLGEASLEIGARLFYAQQDTVTPMWAAGLWAGSQHRLAYALISPLGLRGLVVATTVGFWVETSLLLGVAHRRLGGIVARGVVLSLGTR